MQNKRYDSLERQTVTSAGGLGTISIENDENTTVNYHGIRFQGRIVSDISDNAAEFGSGWITLMCLPPGVSTPVIDSSADANSFHQFIIATQQYATHSGGASTDTGNGNGAGSIFDFDIVPRTSRNCMKGAKIVGQVVNESVGINMILTDVLSMFETTN